MRIIPVYCLFALSMSAFAAERLELDSYGGSLALPGKKTGWFHVQEIGGRWFFVTPEGHAFFSLGATHAISCIGKDELDLFNTKYQGSEELLSRFILEKFQEWNYNSAGYGALEPMEKRLPYAAVIWIEGPVSLAAGTKSAFADVFDATVQERIRETVRTKAERHIQNRNCLGYLFIDLPTWHNAFNRTKPTGSYVDYFRSLKPYTAGREAYAAFLKKRWGADPEGFRAAYGMDLDSLDELPAIDIAPEILAREKPAEDDEQFLNEVADAYYRCATSELRRIDPNHLILGDRFMADSAKTYDSILAVAAKYVDVISFQPMGTKTLLGDYIDHVHELTGKPILLADVNCVLERPTKDLKDTSDYERAVSEHTEKYYLDAARRTSCIGIHRCTIRDYQPWNLNFFRRGLLRADDSPYPILGEFTRRTNEMVYQMVYSPALRVR